MTHNEQLYEAAQNAINELFGDTSVSRSECIGNLENLIGEIETMIDSLNMEIEIDN